MNERNTILDILDGAAKGHRFATKLSMDEGAYTGRTRKAAVDSAVAENISNYSRDNESHRQDAEEWCCGLRGWVRDSLDGATLNNVDGAVLCDFSDLTPAHFRVLARIFAETAK